MNIREIEKINKNLSKLKELSAENLTNDHAPLIIEKINYLKDLNTDILDSNGEPINDDITMDDICQWIVDTVVDGGCLDDCDENMMSDINEINSYCDDCLASEDACVPEGECPDGYLEDCSGDGDCAPEVWVGDGVCDETFNFEKALPNFKFFARRKKNRLQNFLK